ncbi:hypothetical protein [Allohahella marinimesophila]|uniref:Secreted protein n=1 Tax=Allohahella marinimesophila TaxID=1054972 RepID=A0ABP7PZ91_9GAMM
MFNASNTIIPFARHCLLTAPLLLAPFAHASYIMPEQIRIDINWVPEQIDLNYTLDYGASDEYTTVEVLFFGAFFATYASERSEPWFNVGYVHHEPGQTAFDMSDMLRMFLFDEGFDGQTYNFMNRVSMEDTYVFAYESEAYYIPANCVPYEDEDCPPILAAYAYGETLITFYDSGDGTDNPGPGNPAEVSLPGSLPLAMIAALGIFGGRVGRKFKR